MSDQAHAVCRIAQQAGGWPASEHGHTLLELLFAVACMAVVSGIAVASIGRTIERSRGLAAARYLAARMTLARTQAVTWGSAANELIDRPAATRWMGAIRRRQRVGGILSYYYRPAA